MCVFLFLTSLVAGMGIALSPTALQHHSPRLLCHASVNPLLETALSCRELTQRAASVSNLSRHSSSSTATGAALSPRAAPSTPPIYRRHHSSNSAAAALHSPGSVRRLSRSVSMLSPGMQRQLAGPRWNSSTKLNSPSAPAPLRPKHIGQKSPLWINKSKQVDDVTFLVNPPTVHRSISARSTGSGDVFTFETPPSSPSTASRTFASHVTTTQESSNESEGHGDEASRKSSLDDVTASFLASEGAILLSKSASPLCAHTHARMRACHVQLLLRSFTF